MAEKLLMKESCAEFSKLLGAKVSMPGGGAASALVGALGSALCQMAANFTVGNKRYLDVEDEMKSIVERSDKLRARLIELADEDAKAFPELSAAWKLPKDAPDRQAIFEKAALNACKAPLEMVKCCCEAIDLLSVVMEKGNVMLISDVGCGVLLCEAAMNSAAMNIYINAGSLRHSPEAREIESQTDELLAEYLQKADDISGKVTLIVRRV
ncbi:MAG: cyclodeaminase/cyclohydrolase family protein [Synergistaceae bacterium]|nr:cyclodeaminase/cyclohydrolase family protein [Synergistaceae bacterium]MBQ9574974.1 cyclodeaminase/cyclohydrolase family protein [Synergistaceae bacterium]